MDNYKPFFVRTLIISHLMFEGTSLDYNKAVIDLFYEQVRLNPQHIAVADEFTQLSYQALNEKSNQIADYILKQGIRSGDFIGTLLQTGVDFIVVLLSVLKAKAAYLPLDASLPDLRIFQIINESKPKFIITDDNYPSTYSIQCIKINDLYKQSMVYSKENLDNPSNIDNPVCLIYTSGSTGKPKGVLISNKAIFNLAIIENTFKINQQDVFAQFSNPMFDGAMFEIWISLLNGAKLVIIPQNIKTNFIKLKYFLENNGIRFLFLPTSYFHLLARSKPYTVNCLKGLMIGGEQVNVNLLREFIIFRKENLLPLTLINGYGPTETTAYISRHILHEDSPLSHEFLSSIGTDIKNSRSYVLDNDGNLATEGELYVSGANLAIGYYGDDALTREKFILNPFSQDEPYKRLYKTGDKVKRLPCGKLLFLGRLDDQVKVRGFRVHLSEIEAQLMNHPDVIQATVLAEETVNQSHKRLSAYLVISTPLLKAKAIRQFLGSQLPPYMVPAKYFAIENLPLTAIGKIDKKKLSSVSKINLDPVEFELID